MLKIKWSTSKWLERNVHGEIKGLFRCGGIEYDHGGRNQKNRGVTNWRRMTISPQTSSRTDKDFEVTEKDCGGEWILGGRMKICVFYLIGLHQKTAFLVRFELGGSTWCRRKNILKIGEAVSRPQGRGGSVKEAAGTSTGTATGAGVGQNTAPPTNLNGSQKFSAGKIVNQYRKPMQSVEKNQTSRNKNPS